jgi:hypothetical protein
VRQHHKWTQQESSRAADIFAIRFPGLGSRAVVLREIAAALNRSLDAVEAKYYSAGASFARKRRQRLDLPRVKRFRRITRQEVASAGFFSFKSR